VENSLSSFEIRGTQRALPGVKLLMLLVRKARDGAAAGVCLQALGFRLLGWQERAIGLQ